MQTHVTDVRAGDQVRVADGIAQVKCVVRIARPLMKKLVALPGGLMITPHHPVRINGDWQLPRELATRMVDNHSGCVYNFILDRCHILLVNGIECVTWNHGIPGTVVGHPFFGTSRVLHDLEAMSGWEQGFIRVEGCFRNEHGEVTKLREEAPISDPSSATKIHQVSNEANAMGFGNVLKMIDQQIVTLKKEQLADDNKKE